MRTALSDKLEAGRITSGHWGSIPGTGPYGLFDIWGPCGCELRIMASAGEDLKEPWEHVSVSTRRRTPNWQEMCFVKSLFWNDEDTVIQYHPPASSYVNNHPHCLHLWRPPFDIPLPPSILVGIKALGTLG